MSDNTKLYQSENIADAYAKYRPTYNSDVYETIVSFCKETGACDFSLAVDLGCGPGQSAVPLTRYFKQVIGLDISEAQVARAPKNIPNLSFRVGLAEDLSFLQDDSVDLVTVGAAVHWMDHEKLYPEVERVLKPGGAFVAYSYTFPTLGERKAQEIYKQDLMSALEPYRLAESRLLSSRHYDDYTLPFPGWRRLKEMDPDGGTLEEERRLAVAWPMFMMMGHKPQA